MNIEDDDYIERLRELREKKFSLIDNLSKNDETDKDLIGKLKEVCIEEYYLTECLIEDRKYLSDTIKIDPLTGLYNRRILPKIREIGTVIMCDIDNFKTINDTFGHDVGDEAIKAVSHTILDNIRVGDIACRFGGDEFLIVFTTDIFDVIDRRMKKIADDVNDNIDLPDFPITLSIGVAFNEKGEKIEQLIEKADQALYESKENGKNQVTYYGMDKEKTKKARGF